MGGFTFIGVAPRSRGVRGNVWSRLFFVEFRSVVRGYHVYKRVWTPVLGEHAPCRCMRIKKVAALYHLFIKRRLKIIQVVVGAIFRKKKIP